MWKRRQKDWRPVAIDAFKKAVPSKHNRTKLLMASQRLWQCSQGLCRIKPGRVSALRGGGGGHKVPHLPKKLFSTGALWQKENQFSPMECLWVYQPFSSLTGRSSWLAQLVYVSFGGPWRWFIWFGFDIFLLLVFWLLLFLFYLCFFKRERKKMKLSG